MTTFFTAGLESWNAIAELEDIVLERLSRARVSDTIEEGRFDRDKRTGGGSCNETTTLGNYEKCWKLYI